MQRLHLFGASGVGVTTLGQRLSQELGLLYVDTDAYHWLPTHPPYQVRRPVAMRTQLLQADLQSLPGWILGGTVYNWDPGWATAFDLAVYLWVPPAIRLARLAARENNRPPDGRRPQEAAKFLAWSAHYDDGSAPGRSRLRHEAWMAQLRCPLVRIEGDTTVDYRLQLIREAVDGLNAG